MEYFRKAKFYERALWIINELELNCSHRLSASKKQELSQIKESCLNLIKTEERFQNEYFLVEFWGKDFMNADGKKYIYRGGELERLGAFVKRFKVRYSNAEIIYDSPSPEMLKSGKPCKNPVRRMTLIEAHSFPIRYSNPIMPLAIDG